MALSHVLSILLKGTNLAGPALKGAGADVESLTDKLVKLTKSIKGMMAFKLVAGVLKGFATVIGTVISELARLTSWMVKSGVEAVKYAADLESVTNAFNTIAGEAAPAMLKALRESSAFMLDDLTLQRKYVEGYLLIGETLVKRMPEAFEYLTKVSVATGDDVDWLMQRLNRSIGRLSTRWMAYLGTVVPIEEATARAAEMFGKEADALSRTELQAGMLDRALLKLKAATEGMPPVLGTTTQMLTALRVGVKNLGGAFGTIFLPAARSVVGMLYQLINGFTSLVSKGGALYDFFRTISAAIAVAAESIQPLLKEFFKLEGTIGKGLKRLADNMLSTAWKAFSWGVNIATQLAAGLIKGAATAIVAAINFITNLLTFWFAPGSPPRIAPDIVQWGMETMEEWLLGFTLASFDILEGIQGPLESVLGALVSAGDMDKGGAAGIFLSITDDLAEAIIELQQTGRITERMFERLAMVGRGFGKHLVALAKMQINFSLATERAERATLALAAAEKEVEDSTVHLSKTTSDYYTMLIRQASYEELKAKRLERDAAKRRAAKAKEMLKGAEVEQSAAERMLELTEDQLNLQGRLLDQLVLLLQKQTEFEGAASSAGGGGSAAAGGGGAGGAGFELPEIEMPGGGLAGGLDQAFEDLKKKVKAKFDELWLTITKTWEESGAGKAWADMMTAFDEFNLWLDENDIKAKLEDIVLPIRDWIVEDIWGWAVDEWDTWKTWWDEDGPMILTAATAVLDGVLKLFEITWPLIALAATAGMDLVRGAISAGAELILTDLDWDVIFGFTAEGAESRVATMFPGLISTGEAAGGSMVAAMEVGVTEGIAGIDWDAVFGGLLPDFERFGGEAGEVIVIGAGQGITGELPEYQKILRQIGEGLALLLPDFGRFGGEAGEVIVIGAEQGITRELPDYNLTLRKLGESLRTLMPDFTIYGEETGGSMIAGMEEGISAGSGNVLTALQGIGREVEGYIAEFGSIDWDAVFSFTAGEGESRSEEMFPGFTERIQEQIAKIKELGENYKLIMPELSEAVSTAAEAIKPHWENIKSWIDTKLTQPAQELYDNWTGVWWPDIETAVNTAVEGMGIDWTATADWLNNKLTIAITALSALWDTDWTGMGQVVSDTWTDIQTWWAEMKLDMEVAIPRALAWLKEKWGESITGVITLLTPLKTLWDNLVSGVKSFKLWLDTNVFSFDFNWPELPEWAQQKSPMKIHTGMKNFSDFLKTTTFSPNMDFGEGVGMSGGDRHIYIERVVVENVNNMDDLLRQIEVYAT